MFVIYCNSRFSFNRGLVVLLGTHSQRVNEISELLPEWGDLHVIWSFYS